eukprot:2630294-Amphidinium_carterae.1
MFRNGDVNLQPHDRELHALCEANQHAWSCDRTHKTHDISQVHSHATASSTEAIHIQCHDEVVQQEETSIEPNCRVALCLDEEEGQKHEHKCAFIDAIREQEVTNGHPLLRTKASPNDMELFQRMDMRPC